MRPQDGEVEQVGANLLSQRRIGLLSQVKEQLLAPVPELPALVRDNPRPPGGQWIAVERVEFLAEAVELLRCHGPFRQEAALVQPLPQLPGTWQVLDQGKTALEVAQGIGVMMSLQQLLSLPQRGAGTVDLTDRVAQEGGG